jgi:hypothetical protein
MKSRLKQPKPSYSLRELFDCAKSHGYDKAIRTFRWNATRVTGRSEKSAGPVSFTESEARKLLAEAVGRPVPLPEPRYSARRVVEIVSSHLGIKANPQSVINFAREVCAKGRTPPYTWHEVHAIVSAYRPRPRG